MLSKITIVFLFAACVSAVSTFIGDHKRAEIFELTDNVVAVFKVYLPDNEFIQLKEDGEKGLGFDFTGNFNDTEGFNWFNNTGDFNWFNNTGDFNWFNNTDGFGFGNDTNFDFGGIFDQESFKTKNATMSVEINGNERQFKKITFSIGGSSSRSFGKQGYNFKIRGKENLYGRTQFRLRPDAREATFLRSKLLCDVHNRLGIPSVSANYATLYINDEYMGFYILMDSIKLSWIDFVYGDKDSTSLYRCKDVNNDLSVKMSSTGCINDNEEVTDNSEWIEFLTALDSAQSAEDIENIFDIDLFLTEIAIEYISGSWDHYLIYGHNFYLYKPKDDKWKFIVYDYDGDFGQDIDMGINGMSFDFTAPRNPSTDYPTYSFEEWTKSRHLVDILILNNSTRFDNILTNLVSEIFNPATLFPYIDELKEFVRPYVELDKIPDENGKYPGRLNEKSGDYSLAEWDANCEFTTVRSSQGSRGYGLKYWILAKYRYICKAYNMECDQTYLDENYEYTIDKEVEADDNDGWGSFGNWGGQNGQDGQGNWGNWGNWGGFGQASTTSIIKIEQPTTIETDEPTTILADQPTSIEASQPTNIEVVQPSNNEAVQQITTETDEPTTILADQSTAIEIAQPTNIEVVQSEITETDEPTTILADQSTTIEIAQPTNIEVVQSEITETDEPTTILADQTTTIEVAQPTNIEVVQSEITETDEPTTILADQTTTIEVAQPTNIEVVQSEITETDEPTTILADQTTTIEVAQPTNIEVVQSEITETDEPTTILADQTTTIEVAQPTNIEVVQSEITETDEPTTILADQTTTIEVAQPTNIEVVQSEITETDEPTTILADQTTTIEVAQPTTIVVPQPTTIPNKYNCWVEQFGYPCCSSRNKIVYAHDGEGDWGYDFSKMEWCGITPYTEHINDEECWSEVLGYPCCKSCTVYDTDSDGQWGYEDEHWCGIQSYCQN